MCKMSFCEPRLNIKITQFPDGLHLKLSFGTFLCRLLHDSVVKLPCAFDKLTEAGFKRTLIHFLVTFSLTVVVVVV